MIDVVVLVLTLYGSPEFGTFRGMTKIDYPTMESCIEAGAAQQIRYAELGMRAEWYCEETRINPENPWF